MESRPVHIYVLKEDMSDEVRYVGQTVNPRNRYREHMRISLCLGDVNSQKRAWIERARDKGVFIRLVVIETCTREQADEREAYWVQRYLSLGHRLTNGTETGGRGAWRPNKLRKIRQHGGSRIRVYVKERLLSKQEIVDLWIEGWDGFRKDYDSSHVRKIDRVRAQLTSKEIIEQLDVMLTEISTGYPAFKDQTPERWLELAKEFDDDYL